MNPFFDTLIILFLFSAIILAWAIFRDSKRSGTFESRHSTISMCFYIFIFLCFYVVAWGSFIEPRLIAVNYVSVDLPNFEPAKPVKIAFISDVHVGTYKKDGWIKKISSRITKLNPDAVLIAGDFIVNKSKQAKYLSGFEQFSSNIPVYAVLGDHDYRIKNKGHEIIRVDEESAYIVADTLKKAGVQILRNESREIKINNDSFLLVGLDELLSGKTNMSNAISQLTNQQINQLPTIVLIHNPDFILSEELTAKAGQTKKADLILSGNTHGGQIRLPFIGAVSPLPSRLPRSFDQGMFILENNRKLFITSGIGESGPRARLFNPPEIVLLEIF